MKRCKDNRIYLENNSTGTLLFDISYKMKIIIDERETTIYEKCQEIVRTNLAVPGQKPQQEMMQIEKQVLPIGDILLKTTDGADNQIVCIIERKTIADLLASIKDGRYAEQSYRLANQGECPIHNIVYIIEGNINALASYTEKRLVLSTMASIGFFKGFSVIRTGSAIETAEWIIWTADKIERKLRKREQLAHRKIQISGDHTAPLPTSQEYSTVVKKVKKENITKENIAQIILCQIPGISSTTAMAIMEKFTSFVHLLESLKENPTCLDNIQYNSNGKMRKISKACIESIKQLLID